MDIFKKKDNEKIKAEEKKKLTAAEIYRKYESGIKFFDENKIISRAKKCVRLYEGDHWYDENVGGNRDNLPFYNFTKSIVDYKTSMVSKNNMSIVYNPMNTGENRGEFSEVCRHLNAYAEDRWEHLKMDVIMWELVKKSAITGDAYIYFANRDLFPQIIDKTNIFFADEQERLIQNQKYIIISERRFVEDIKGKCPKELADLVVADEPENQINNEDNEVKNDIGKVTSLLYLYKNEAGNVCYAKSTKAVIYEEGEITGLNLYPIAAMVWQRKYNSARGLGEVWGVRANQVATNKNLYRREQAVKISAFSKPVYVKDAIENPEAIMQLGSAVELDADNVVEDIHKLFGYIQPAPMSGDAKVLQDEIMQVTRELANAGDNATGNIDPEAASGKAISLVVDQNAMLLTEQSAVFKQCVEDIALIWFEMWYAYNPNGMAVEYPDKEAEGDEMVNQFIPAETLAELMVNVRIDVSPTNAWSIYTNDQEALNLLGNQMVSFEEYVDLLTDSNPMKGKLKNILKQRQEQQQQQMLEQQMQEQAMQEQMLQQAAMQQAVPEDNGSMSGMQDMGGASMNGGILAPADVPVAGNALTSL